MSQSLQSKSCARLEVCHLQAGDCEVADSSRTLQVCIAVLQIQKFTRFLNSIPEPWDAVPPKKSTYSIQQNFDLIQFIPPDLSKWQSPIFLTLKQKFCQQTFSAKLHAIAGAVKALFSINGSQIWTTMLLIVFSLNHVKTLALFQVKNHLPKLHWALKAQTHQYLPISTTISTTCFRRLKACHSLQLKLQLTQIIQLKTLARSPTCGSSWSS